MARPRPDAQFRLQFADHALDFGKHDLDRDRICAFRQMRVTLSLPAARVASRINCQGDASRLIVITSA